jgi:3-hydroxyisobutyrate dehydrogenase-like beta-hydroxyacid dehydrogenase
MAEKISFLGLGNMGAGMASTLLKKGIDLSVYNRSKDKAEPLVKEGAKLLNGPEDALKNSDIAISMVANDKALTEISEKLLQGARKGTIHISMSTVSPETIKELQKKHEAKGVQLLSAPVFGRPDVAAKGELWISLAGNEDAKKKVLPYLEMLGKKVYDFGTAPYASNVVKVSGNFLILSVIEMLSEAFAALSKNGINPEGFLNLMTDSLFPSPVFKNYGKIVLDRKFQPAGFKLELGLKDINLFLSTADDAPLANLLKKRLTDSIEKGRSDFDWSAISLLSLK